MSNKLKSIVSVMMLTVMMLTMSAFVSSPAVFGQSEKITGADTRNKQTTATIREGQFTQFTVERLHESSGFTVSNPTDLVGDVDLVVIDIDGAEIDRTSVELAANTKTTVEFKSAFPEVDLASVHTINVGVSLRARPVYMAEARTLPINFFSQRDSRWKNAIMGPSGLSVGSYGCAMTSVAMAGCYKMTNLTPLTLNGWLSSNSGYTSGGSLYWAKPPGFQPSSGFKYIGTGVGTVKNAANLKSLIDGGNFVIAFSYRFSTHWVVIYKYNGSGSKLSDFEYLDPYDLSYTLRKVDDGKVKSTSQIRIYK